MKSEAKFWEWLRDRIGHAKGFEFERIENRVGRSTPDVCFSWDIKNQRSSVTRDITSGHGWIELKSIYPITDFIKTAGVIRVPHFTKGQKRWLTRRGAMGGFCYLFLEAGNDLILLNHKYCYSVGSMSWDEMKRSGFYWTKKTFDLNEFLYTLITDMRDPDNDKI